MLFGADREIAKTWLGDQPAEEEDCYVWTDNWPTLQLFLALQTQWRLLIGMGGASYAGLDYAAVNATMQMLTVPRRERAEMFAGLTLMERAALPLLNAKKDS